jgi:ABC-type nickel/cobalt efflux system permease component RcnA
LWRLAIVLRETLGVIVVVVFLAGFVWLMNHISDPNFNGDANFYSYIAAAIIIFATLMMYWERMFPAGGRRPRH